MAIQRSGLVDTTRTVFRVAYLAVLLLAIGWASGNVRQVPADSRAVVRHFGRVDRVQASGLVLAWPSPIDEITLLPAAGQQTALKIESLANAGPSSETDFQPHQPDDVVELRKQRDAWNGQYFLTGDSGVVQFDATLNYRITEPAAFVLSQDHIVPALQRLFRASTVEIAAGHDLDDFLVARPELAAADRPDREGRRQAVRDALMAAINRRLLLLKHEGGDLGIEVSRLDMIVLLPPLAKTAFDNVLTASQIADQTEAAARTDAARISQEAQRAADRTRSAAAAAAEEQTRTAAAQTATITALHAQMTPENRSMLLTQYYREQIGAVLQAAGRVTSVDAQGSQVILPGAAE